MLLFENSDIGTKFMSISQMLSLLTLNRYSSYGYKLRTNVIQSAYHNNVLKIFVKSQKKNLCRSLFFIKLQAYNRQICLNRDLSVRFLCVIYEIFLDSFILQSTSRRLLLTENASCILAGPCSKTFPVLHQLFFQKQNLKCDMAYLK